MRIQGTLWNHPFLNSQWVVYKKTENLSYTLDILYTKRIKNHNTKCLPVFASVYLRLKIIQNNTARQTKIFLLNNYIFNNNRLIHF
jgi:hypothetical protein